jgi:hypothetical protein
MNAGKLISGEEVAKHNRRESCWIIVHGAEILPPICLEIYECLGKVYDVTEFLDGGCRLAVGFLF